MALNVLKDEGARRTGGNKNGLSRKHVAMTKMSLPSMVLVSVHQHFIRLGSCTPMDKSLVTPIFRLASHNVKSFITEKIFE